MVKIRYSDEFICPKCGRHTALVFHVNGTHQAHCMICDAYFDVEIAPITNADRIRAMSDEELADFLDRWELGDIDYAKTFCNLCKGQYDCHNDCLLDWLRQEVEE